ncbi:MAG: ATP-binding protein [Formivibrio sp.]|nr:ATP-binding protein [Formivibrio sp.]
MGRLFWKFFFFIWLAQLTATLGIGAAFWVRDHSLSRALTTLDQSPPASMLVESAALTFEFGGQAALHALLQKNARHQIMAIDEQGHDLLQRPVNPAMLAQARTVLSKPSNRPTVLLASSPSTNKQYLLFTPLTEHYPAGELPSPSLNRPPPGGEHFLPMIPLATALIASLLFAILLAWYFAKPIRSLRFAFENVSQGHLDTRIAPAMGRRRDELADLGRDFDHMVGQLQALMEGQRRLLHDVSHEIRSPLARLQVAVGLARQQPHKLEASMERIERESERMDLLVGELLSLSRLEVGASRNDTEVIVVSQLITQIEEDARFEADANGRKVVVDQCAEAVLNGQPELLHRALDNVLRNAIRHSPQEGCVHIQIRKNEGENILTLLILDEGNGVAPNELEAIFEPFYRGENPVGNGHGLGLAIARRIITAHGGRIHARNRASGGLCVEINLPLAQA